MLGLHLTSQVAGALVYLTGVNIVPDTQDEAGKLPDLQRGDLLLLTSCGRSSLHIDSMMKQLAHCTGRDRLCVGQLLLILMMAVPSWAVGE